MTEKSIDELRAELKTLGYLSHGLERWFAQDPWRSRTFWTELLLVASKATVLLAAFTTIPLVFEVASRNHPVSVPDVFVLFVVYFLFSFVGSFILLVGAALILKAKPNIAIDSPVSLMSISLSATALPCAGIVAWWLGFDGPPAIVDAIILVTLLLILLAVGTIVVSAALLSFSIHESRRIPSIHRRSRTKPLAFVGVAMFLGVVAPTWLTRQREAERPPQQVVVSPSDARLIVIAVEGLTRDMFDARADLAARFARVDTIAPLREPSPAAMWATVGTGTPDELHGVRAVDGIVLVGSDRVLQTLSSRDVPLRRIGVSLGLAHRQVLPPSLRERSYVWEEMARRGVTVVAVNWWASDDVASQNLTVVSQEAVFADAAGNVAHTPRQLALSVDRVSLERLEKEIEVRNPRFATVYLPALDILLNRLDLDDGAKVAGSVAALDEINEASRRLAALGYEATVIGLPGSGQSGDGVLASTFEWEAPRASAFDLAPTILDLFGFPASEEMTGSSLLRGGPSTPRIRSYGSRQSTERTREADDDYFESLRSLGYIQ